ncbi:D,D-heptose 1-phosphate adenosyltransferase / D,D-heptose 7-phosphate kinase [Campylobacter blaseri]|uniref:Bifunctional protein HldE n=1 Tax=Campylobacter blaseri TaxID=2042961 RepID=A0A2P8QZN8_9BACT|nr:D-glycero-beta-D-manno-heptose-7-phosphate kinase [Campylobacter blaseri]PSM51716.1 bifunctional heptose 7-phosphate kinase/heptose 1-phosphate adenyltransferase [Campylobacter blaseri]PSM53507.1 bifunctional heptose 7-phosphate kinase/heptose 1-phosphate adenyltransferase [Campylobacter blaseri]QKF86313.1 D,D-heptose 1-phosphate adenosyltransferase / D,D-heptose 7-phosphate kinase [Campylobacter blaseri]
MYNIKDKEPKILVIGDLMLDRYLWGNCDRISPEAPVQVIDVKNETKHLGGAGNVLNNLLSLGAKVGIISVVGDDKTSKIIEKILDEKLVKIEFLHKQKRRLTSQKTRIISSKQQIVRFDKESVEDICEDVGLKLLDKFKDIAKNYEVVVLSDYGKGVLSDNICKQIIKISNELNLPVLIDPKGSDYSKYKNATLLTPNKKEAYEATGIKIIDNESLQRCIKKLKDELNLKYSLITLSEQGVAFYDDKLTIIPAIARDVFDVTGAGDTVLSALSYMLACKEDIKDAVIFANKAAAVVVAKVGSATVTFEEIEHYEREKGIGELESRIKTKEELKQILSSSNKKIVFTNGCFDILHAGHVKYLKTAKSFGDILVVGLNSDNSVKILKGKERPINSELDRAVLLSALSFVDYVVIFNEQTPYDLIKYLKPNVLVKGGDYEGKEVVGSDLVDELKLVKFEDGKSTTGIIKRIKNERND